MRSPPPAEEQANAGASAARGSASARVARHASHPSSTSVSMVVRCDAVARRSPVSRWTRAALVKVEPKSTQMVTVLSTRSTVSTGSTIRGGRSAKRPVEVREKILDRLDAHRQPDQVGRYLEVGARNCGVCHPAGMLDQRLDP